MKQLEPILKYHFWILLFIGIVMAVVGWWMTTGQMQAATSARRAKIEEANKKIKDLKDVPSKDYEEKLKVINGEQDKLIRQSRAWLYARQKERMVWPSWIREASAPLKYMEEFKDTRHHIIYRNRYMEEVERVYEVPRPITPEHPDGLVMFPFSAMPHREWGDEPPTSKQMWESMEDLWLLEPLLQAILEANGGVNGSRHDASIVAIEYIRLHGGDRSKIGQAASMSGGGGGGGMGADAGPGLGAMGMGMGMGMGVGDPKAMGALATRSMSTSGPGVGSFDLNQVDDLGDPGTGDAGGGGGGGIPGTMGMGANTDEDRPVIGAFGGGGFGGMLSSSAEEVGRRYIDDDPALPYRTRGFKLTVVMDHLKVPDLFAQLTSNDHSPWPVKILRMNVAEFLDSSPASPAGSPSRGLSPYGGANPFSGAMGGSGFGGRGRNDDEDRPVIGAFTMPNIFPAQWDPKLGIHVT